MSISIPSTAAGDPIAVALPPPRRSRRRRWLLLGAALTLIVYLSLPLLHGPSSAAGQYVSEPVTRGPIAHTVTATGALNPVTTVLVGAQVSGTVARRLVDYNSRVQAGQVLLQLDPTLLQADVDQAAAELTDKVAQQALAAANLQRQQRLVERGFLSPAALDQYRQALTSAEGQHALAQAKLARARINLGYTTVRSPVAGVVVAREVEVGQTVAANFQTPTLLRIAPDLKQMQIDSNVAEADVGALRPGLAVEFTVDAYPQRRFTGRVRQVRLNPTIQQNVVTYNVVVDAPNDDEALLPGMTAQLKFEVARREAALRVPNAALRYSPAAAGKQAASGSTVYLLDGRGVQPRQVKTGISDGRYTELPDGEVAEGTPVVTAETGARDEARPPLRLRMM